MTATLSARGWDDIIYFPDEIWKITECNIHETLFYRRQFT